MIVTVPRGYISVIETKLKDRKRTKKVRAWDAVWIPQEKLLSTGTSKPLRFRSVSKKSSEDAVLRLKHKVAAYFGGAGWKSRTASPNFPPKVDLSKQPWGTRKPIATTPGKRPILNRPTPKIPAGSFRTTKRVLEKYKDGTVQTYTEWITVWIPAGEPKQNQNFKFSSWLSSKSRLSPEHSRLNCEKKLNAFYMPREHKLQVKEKARISKEYIASTIDQTVIQVPKGRISAIYEKTFWGHPRLLRLQWHPVGIESLVKLRAASGDEAIEFIDVFCLHNNKIQNLDFFRRTVLKTFSGPIKKKSWNESLPTLDLSLDPWSQIASDWEREINPGISRIEFTGSHIHVEPYPGEKFGHHLTRITWNPARDFGELSVPEIFYEHPDSEIALHKCVELVEAWYLANNFGPSSRPNLLSPPNEVTAWLPEALKSPITSARSWRRPPEGKRSHRRGK